MTTPAVTVSTETSVKEALQLLDEHRVTSLPVTDSRGRLAGVVSEADLLVDAVHPDARAHMRAPESDELRSRTPLPGQVEEVMSRHPMTVRVDSDLSDAVKLMTATAAKSLPVVDSGRVVGVVSRSDVIRRLARHDDIIRAEVDDLLRTAGLECVVEVTDGVVVLEDLEDQEQWRAAQVIAGSPAGVRSVQVRPPDDPQAWSAAL